jgi:hypothetical protein
MEGRSTCHCEDRTKRVYKYRGCLRRNGLSESDSPLSCRGAAAGDLVPAAAAQPATKFFCSNRYLLIDDIGG